MEMIIGLIVVVVIFNLLNRLWIKIKLEFTPEKELKNAYTRATELIDSGNEGSISDEELLKAYHYVKKYENNIHSDHQKYESEQQSYNDNFEFETTGQKNLKTIIKNSLRDKILNLGMYHPYHGGNNPEFDTFSKKILDLKNDDSGALEYFFNKLKYVDFDNTEVIVIVPSHSTNNKMSSVGKLAQKLANYHGWIDGTECVKRVKTIDKLAHGGNRNISTHLNSLTIVDKHLLQDKNVLVFDDVTTSGNSLEAAMQLLRKVNVKSVWSYALAKTS